MTDQGPAKTAEATTPEAAPSSSPAAADAPAPTPTSTADIVDVTADDTAGEAQGDPAETEKAKKGRKKLARSAGLPAPLPAEASTAEDPPTATTESPRPGKSLRPDPATQGTTRQTTDLDLTSFMASFHPGLASEPRPAAEARGVAAPAAPSSNVQDEMQRLREKLEALRSRVAGVRL
ncbi:hypothetical protein PR003_g1907 [Phytophthora rubi]|uniref:Uncharacterized protein n=1 Tax=Phytophthora rubi TaxID=129364 RepID=A0A6A3P6M8_9STRA|nr:hypothetical protein PR001_g1686 [Phytophthora rubi]KAE9357240.1 hypothetical protein PR003_g1907 [Phytophthora rubi]